MLWLFDTSHIVLHECFDSLVHRLLTHVERVADLDLLYGGEWVLARDRFPWDKSVHPVVILRLFEIPQHRVWLVLVSVPRKLVLL